MGDSEAAECNGEDPASFVVGDRVEVINLKDHLWMEGLIGTLIEQRLPSKWLVDLCGAEGRRSPWRRRWLIPVAQLQHAKTPVVPEHEARRSPSTTYFVVGSWNDWNSENAEPMSWDADRQCLHLEIEVGNAGQESFQIVVDRDWERVLHPTRAQDLDWRRCLQASIQAAPGSSDAGLKLNFIGPDSDSHGKNWTIGTGQEQGARYELRVSLWGDQAPSSVELELKAKPNNQRAHLAAAPKESFFLIGTWNDWSPPRAVRMTWDESLSCLVGKVQLSNDGLERFQIVVERDFARRIHPDKPNSSLAVGVDPDWELCGPHGQGDGKDWILGNDGVKGTSYQVQLHLWRDATPAKLEIVKATTPTSPLLVSPSGPVGQYYLVGSFIDWNIENARPMQWDAEKHYLKGQIPIGLMGQQEFQIVVNKNWQQCIHPDRQQVGLDEHWQLRGPDHRGRGLNWMIGQHVDAGVARYEVRLQLWAHEQPAALRAVRL